MKVSAVSIAILAGGASQRFGTDKVFAKFRGMPLIKHLVWRFREHTDDLFIVSRFDQPDRLQSVDIPIVYDSCSQRTIMGAILDSLEASKNDWVLILAVDLPLINWSIINLIYKELSLNKEALCVIPKLIRGSQPLCGLYNKECVDIFKQKLSVNKQRMQDVCQEEYCANVSIPNRLQWQFLNMNTQEDLKKAEQLADKNQLNFLESGD